MEWTWPASIDLRRTEPGASSRRWPTISSRLAGRMRSASGRMESAGEPSRSPPAGGWGERREDTSGLARTCARAGQDTKPPGRVRRHLPGSLAARHALLQRHHLPVELLDELPELIDAVGLARGLDLEAVAYHDGILAPVATGIPLFGDPLAVAAVGALVAGVGLAALLDHAAEGPGHRHHAGDGGHVLDL